MLIAKSVKKFEYFKFKQPSLMKNKLILCIKSWKIKGRFLEIQSDKSDKIYLWILNENNILIFGKSGAKIEQPSTMKLNYSNITIILNLSNKVWWNRMNIICEYLDQPRVIKLKLNNILMFKNFKNQAVKSNEREYKK